MRKDENSVNLVGDRVESCSESFGKKYLLLFYVLTG